LYSTELGDLKKDQDEFFNGNFKKPSTECRRPAPAVREIVI